MKLSGWRVQYTITLLVLFGAVLLFIPTSLQSTVQANFISKWKDYYSKIVYMQDVILKHEKTNILTSFKRAKNAEEREELFRTLVKPYLRLSDTKVPKRYHVKFMNNTPVPKNSLYYFTDYYFSDKNMIVGIKDVPNVVGTENIFIMMVDVNGVLPPNTWGKDVFGAKVYADKTEPLGAGLGLSQMKDDCSQDGTGVACSYYYKIGGSFED